MTEEEMYQAGWSDAVTAARELVAKAKALVESVYGDNAKNGDILSRETIKAADDLRMELARW